MISMRKTYVVVVYVTLVTANRDTAEDGESRQATSEVIAATPA